MDLILEYIETIKEIDDLNETGLDNRKKVKRNNTLADRIRSIASEIDSVQPEMKPHFSQLLFHDEESVRIWSAHHILEVMNYDVECRAMALKQIEYIATHYENTNGFGNKIWLRQWLNDHPEDTELL